MAMLAAPIAKPPRPDASAGTSRRHGIYSRLQLHAWAVLMVHGASHDPESGVTRVVVNRSLWNAMPPPGTHLDMLADGGRGGRGIRPAVLTEVHGHGIVLRAKSGWRTFIPYIDLYAPTSHTQILFPRRYAERIDAVCNRLYELLPKTPSSWARRQAVSDEPPTDTGKEG